MESTDLVDENKEQTDTVKNENLPVDIEPASQDDQNGHPKPQDKQTPPPQDDQTVQPPDRDKRIRTLTEGGKEMFDSKQRKFLLQIQVFKSDLQLTSRNIEAYSNDLQSLEEIKSEYMGVTSRYDETCKSYLDFLARTNTQECIEEIPRLQSEIQDFTSMVVRDIRKMNTLINGLRTVEKEDSVKSGNSRNSRHSSRCSNGSKSSSALSRSRAKAEAQKVRVKFAEMETKMLKEKASLEHKQAYIAADIKLLKTKTEAAVSEAEADALQNEIDEEMSQVLPDKRPMDRYEKVTSYIDKADDQHVQDEQLHSTLDPCATPFTPADHQSYATNRNNFDDKGFRDRDIATDFTRFLLKRELLMSRFSVFNDKPEYYPSWKDSFINIIQDIGAEPSEEIDLLLKWTGPQSRIHVQSIRAANMGIPSIAKRQIWERLDERYGSPELIDNALKTKLLKFPRITNKDYTKLYELSDILSEILSVKDNERYSVMFSYFDSSIGISPIVSKLPYQLQERWTGTAVDYNSKHGTMYPPFRKFVQFVKEQSKIRNNPSFMYENQQTSTTFTNERRKHTNVGASLVRARLTNSAETHSDTNNRQPSLRLPTSELMTFDPSEKCLIHGTNHTLNDCRKFKAKPIHERRRLLRTNEICANCCLSTKHAQRDCPIDIKCQECGKNDHPTALHIKARPFKPMNVHDGEQTNAKDMSTVNAKCTNICKDKFNGKSCAKIVLVEGFMSNDPSKKLKFYAILDDQSNKTLGKSELFDYFGSNTFSDYILSTCSGKSEVSGRKISGLVLQSLDSQTQLDVPDVLECNQIPDSRDEIPTPEVALYHAHLNDIANLIPPLDDDSKILLLIGRDLVSAHHVIDQRVGSHNAPYAQKLPLGWTVIGETCLGKVHLPDEARVKKVHLDVFLRKTDDDKVGLSKDDRDFLKLMDQHFKKDERGNWSAPLPFRQDRQRLPNNEKYALKRAKGLHANLSKNPQKREHFFTFMKGKLEKGHAEKAPDSKSEDEQWFLPIFGVYHPKKPGKLRAVFDSSSQYDGISLNNVLLRGPDVTNSLLGVLLRFRREKVAIMGDIEQMFYSFRVDDQHRNFLKFFWYTDNDFTKPLIAYRMCVHVFGNSPSPAIATYGLRKAAQEAEKYYGSDVVEFVTRDFYVDDGLTSKPTSSEATDLMQRTKAALHDHGNIRLHKISTNDENVMSSFENEDLASGLKNLDLESDFLPVQRTLGMAWNLKTDTFMYNIDKDVKPFTRRGLLSTINSIYDPMGFLAPVTIKGKLLLRSAMTGNIAWDDPLPEDMHREWEAWRLSLFELENAKFSRMFVPISFSHAQKKVVHIYSDASEQAIAAVGFIQLDDDPNVGFLMGKAKVAPTHGHTIPRLELCGALLATEIGNTISEHLDIPLSDIRYYTDSRVVLGYINNTSRRFYNYVSNRVAKIHRVSDPSQWSHVNTEANPADVATRSIEASKLQTSAWITGSKIERERDHEFSLIEPDSDKEVRPEVIARKIEVRSDSKLDIGSHRFERFSCWKRLVRSIAMIKNFIARRIVRKSDEKSVCSFSDAEKTVIKIVQNEIYCDDIQRIKDKSPLQKQSLLLKLNPFVDSEGILRVGGRISSANVTTNERHPIILPNKHWIATLIVRYFHEKTEHQGRHFTAGAVRTGGYWIVGCKRLVSSLIHKCVTCRKLRQPTEQQKMADLPLDRVNPEPPFTSIGIDTFGPWSVISRRTRGGLAHSKRWAILFTCLTSRGVHIEVVEELSSSSFINAFKRFMAIRGHVKSIRSDRGTNFVGATDELGINTINVEDGPTKQFLYENGINWYFNTPHSSHMGGVWERMIRTTRSILNSMLSKLPGNDLSQEVLVTFLAEVTAIINSRPLTCISSDTDEPFPLTPNLIITQKPSVLVPADVSFNCKDMYHAQWKKVQYLADTFWKRWRLEYLQSLQVRQKWTKESANVKEGDVVLLKDNQACRISWPMGIITRVFPSTDNLVRKVEVKIVRQGSNENACKSSLFTRPVTEIVMLLPKK